MVLSNNSLNNIEEEEIISALGEEDLSYSCVSILSTIRFIEGQIEAIEAQVLKKVKGGTSCSLLQTVPGIGVVLGLTIVLESGPLDRFASASHYASYCRCVPTAYWSNSKQKGGGYKKNGNKYLSWAFAEAASFTIRYFKEVKTFYQRKCAKTNQPSAYRAVANKLSNACYYIM